MSIDSVSDLETPTLDDVIVRETLTFGVDEVGRGCHAGDLVVVGVLGGPGFRDRSIDACIRIDDSKKLTPKVRSRSAQWIVNNSMTYCIETRTPLQVEEMNPLHATMDCLKKMIRTVWQSVKDYYESREQPMPHIRVIMDGSYIPKAYTPPPGVKLEACVKGDSAHIEIAAASILAKVARDTSFARTVAFVPHLRQYEFGTGHGYGTPSHLASIVEHGFSRYHRRTYKVGRLNGRPQEFVEGALPCDNLPRIRPGAPLTGNLRHLALHPADVLGIVPANAEYDPFEVDTTTLKMLGDLYYSGTFNLLIPELWFPSGSPVCLCKQCGVPDGPPNSCKCTLDCGACMAAMTA